MEGDATRRRRYTRSTKFVPTRPHKNLPPPTHASRSTWNKNCLRRRRRRLESKGRGGSGGVVLRVAQWLVHQRFSTLPSPHIITVPVQTQITRDRQNTIFTNVSMCYRVSCIGAWWRGEISYEKYPALQNAALDCGNFSKTKTTSTKTLMRTLTLCKYSIQLSSD
jgi:hypothetical protein